MYIYKFILLVFICVCCQKKIEECPDGIVTNNYCDLFNEAKWCFYASNSHGKFQYRDTLTKKNVELSDILSVDLKLFKWIEFNDTIEFTIATDKKFDLDNISQNIKFISFGFNKNNKKLIYRKTGNTKNIAKSINGYIFYTGDKTYQLLDSSYRHNPNYSVDMRSFGLYPINEQDSILISKIKSDRKDINPWIINYAKQKGFIK